MRILITGYRGFIGQNMVKAMADHDLVLHEWEDSYNLNNVDRVIHLGAISSTTYRDVPQIVKQNYVFTVELVNKCMEHCIPIQIASSASVYGPDNKTFVETDKPNPRTPYAWTKYLVEEYCESIVPTASLQIFRYFNVYGPHEDYKGNQASPYHQFAKQAKETGRIRLFEGSENFKRDFVPVEQVIETHKAFFNIEQSGVWNVGTGKSKSFLDVALEVGGAIEWISFPDVLKDSYQSYTCANMIKTNNTIKII